jgi:hypothetical protein
LQKHNCKDDLNILEMFFMCPNNLYPKLDFNNLSKLTLFNTPLVMKTWFNNFSFQKRIQMEDNMKCIKILIV